MEYLTIHMSESDFICIWFSIILLAWFGDTIVNFISFRFKHSLCFDRLLFDYIVVDSDIKTYINRIW